MGHQAAGVITDVFVAEVARATDTDARSVVRRIAGLPVRGRAGKRIDRALAERLKRHICDGKPAGGLR